MSKIDSDTREASIFDTIIYKVREGVAAVDTALPWFDLLIFLKYFFSSLCIYVIADSSWIVLACMVAYRVLLDIEIPIVSNSKGKTKNGGLPSRPSGLLSMPKSDPDFRIPISTLCEVTLRFILEFCSLLFLHFISYIGFSLLTFVLACFASAMGAYRHSLQDRLLLEEIDERKLKVLLDRLKERKPKWLTVEDHERVEWLNKILTALWPTYIAAYLEDKKEDFVNMLKPKVELDIQMLTGKIAPRISSVKVIKQTDMIILDLNVIYGGDFAGTLKWKPGIEVGIDQVQFEADIRIELRDLVGHMPFVGAIQICMEKKPIINFKPRKLATIIEDFKAVKTPIIEHITKSVKSLFPILVPLIDDASESQWKFISSKGKSQNMWDKITSKIIREDSESEDLRFTQKNKIVRNRFSDPSINRKQTQGSRDVSPSPSKTESSSLKDFNRKENVLEEFFTRSDILPRPTKKIISSEQTISFTDLQHLKNDHPIGGSTSGSLRSRDELNQSFSSQSSDEEFNSRGTSSCSASGIKISIESPIAPKSSVEVSSPRRKWEDGGLKDMIARDVEASQVSFQERQHAIVTENDDSRRPDEMLEPFTVVTKSGLTSALDPDHLHGCVELTTKYQAPNTLIVIVHRARNLPKKTGRLPNPYVKLHLQNQELKPLEDQSTRILESIQDPVFDATFEFQLEKPLSEYTLKISAKTKHKFAHNLGQVVLCFAPYRSSQTIKERNWYDLADPKKDHVMCWVGYKDPVASRNQSNDIDVELPTFLRNRMQEQLV